MEHIGGDGIQHLLLTVEVVVDGSPGQAAGFCDVLQGDMLIAVLQKQPLSGVQNGLFRHFPEHLRMQSAWGVARAALELVRSGGLVSGWPPQ